MCAQEIRTDRHIIIQKYEHLSACGISSAIARGGPLRSLESHDGTSWALIVRAQSKWRSRAVVNNYDLIVLAVDILISQALQGLAETGVTFVSGDDHAESFFSLVFPPAATGCRRDL